MIRDFTDDKGKTYDCYSKCAVGMKTEKLLVWTSTGLQRNWASLKDRSGHTDILQQCRCDTSGNCPGKPPWHFWIRKEFEILQRIEKKNNKKGEDIRNGAL